MCKCNQNIRTPFCGRPGCEWPRTEVNRHMVETAEVHLKRLIPLGNLVLERYPDTFLKDQGETMVLQMAAYMRALKDHRIFYNINYPMTWWDALKDRFFPKWALKRWPAKYKKIFIDELVYKAVCPHLPALPENRHFEWLAQRGTPGPAGRKLDELIAKHVEEFSQNAYFRDGFYTEENQETLDDFRQRLYDVAYSLLVGE